MIQLIGLLPVFNKERYLRRCLSSIQGLRRSENVSFHLYIVDDCSSDSSVRVVEDFFSTTHVWFSFTFVKNDKNIGLSANLSQLLDNAEYDYFVRIDADDYVADRLLLDAIQFLRSKVDIIIPDIVNVEHDVESTFNQNVDFFKSILYFTPLPGGVFISKKIYMKTTGYDASLSHQEDYDLFLKMCFHDPQVRHTQRPSYFYNRDSNDMSSSRTRRLATRARLRELFLNRWLTCFGIVAVYIRPSCGSFIDEVFLKRLQDDTRLEGVDLYFVSGEHTSSIDPNSKTVELDIFVPIDFERCVQMIMCSAYLSSIGFSGIAIGISALAPFKLGMAHFPLEGLQEVTNCCVVNGLNNFSGFDVSYFEYF